LQNKVLRSLQKQGKKKTFRVNDFEPCSFSTFWAQTEFKVEEKPGKTKLKGC